MAGWLAGWLVCAQRLEFTAERTAAMALRARLPAGCSPWPLLCCPPPPPPPPQTTGRQRVEVQLEAVVEGNMPLASVPVRCVDGGGGWG